MNDTQTPNATPLALPTGKVRSFWAILGLSIITCGIYYIVYNFMVASELKKATAWGEDEPFKPSTYMVTFAAYVALSYATPMFFIFAVGAKAFMVAMTNPGNAEAAIQNITDPYQLALQIFMLLISIVGYYVVYYFLKLNDAAAVKVGAKPLGIRTAFIAYSIFFAMLLLNSLSDIMITLLDIEPMLGLGDMSDMGDVHWGPIIMMIVMGLGLGMVMFITGIFYLWKQTELVNHVWLGGNFAAPVGGYGNYTAPNQPTNYPAPPVPPVSPPPAPKGPEGLDDQEQPPPPPPPPPQ